MSDQTVYAEALIKAVARAFYEDDAVCLIDVLIHDKFLRDDDMEKRLSLPAKQMRRTLQFLQEEHIVKFELVDDLIEGGSQASKFWYIDYNHAVHVIRLRLYLLRKKLEEAEVRARSSSVYLCPGYKTKVCNGRYTETEAQQVIDLTTGLFLCQECVNAHANNPDPPPKETYTLQLVDNTKDLKLAMDNMRRVNTQLSSKMVYIGHEQQQQLRPGIYDLLQLIRNKGNNSGALTSNLPTENRSMDIGSKRLEGTGRTAGIRWKKRKYLGGSTRTDEGEQDLTFLKNAMGQQIALEVEKGGGARANLLATRGRRRRKLMDAAASRVGVALDAITQLSLELKQRKLKQQQEDKENASKNRKSKKASMTLAFLHNNINRKDYDLNNNLDDSDSESSDSDDDSSDGMYVDCNEEMIQLTEDERRTTFQALYKNELARQQKLLFSSLSPQHHKSTNGDDMNGKATGDDHDIIWEDG